MLTDKQVSQYVLGGKLIGPFAPQEIDQRETVSGAFTGTVQITSGKFAIVEKSHEFTLVPWRPASPASSREVTGIVQGRGCWCGRGDWVFKSRDSQNANHGIGMLGGGKCRAFLRAIWKNLNSYPGAVETEHMGISIEDFGNYQSFGTCFRIEGRSALRCAKYCAGVLPRAFLNIVMKALTES